MKGGLGARARAAGELKIGAVSVVNACGNVVDPTTGTAIAGMRAAADSPEIVSMEDAMLAAAEHLAMPLDRTNTTISCIITNARLTKAQATKLAQMAADAYAHTIRPTHTTNDGDTIYVLASGALGDRAFPLDMLGVAATRVLEEAICAGCLSADGIHDTPAFKDLHN